jgi:hypothetical protein
VISKRTRVLMWCAALPIIVLIATVACLMLIPYYEKLTGSSSHFVAFHFHLIQLALLLCVWGIVLACGLISLLYDKTNSKEK